MSKRATTVKPKMPKDGRMTNPWVRDLRPPTKEQKQFYYFEKQGKGLSLSLYHGWQGTKSFRAHTYDYHTHKTIITKVGVFPDFGVEDARKAALAVFYNPVKHGLGQEQQVGSFADAAERWFEAEIKGKAITEREIGRKLDKYILPVLGSEQFTNIERADVVRFLDKIEADHGAAQANGCLTTISAIVNWQALRVKGDYQPPLLRKLKKKTKAGKGRERVLSAEELRKVWHAAVTMNTTPPQKAFNGLVRLAILTAQRRDKLMTLRWDHIRDGVWTVQRTDEREKGTPKALVLPQLALDVLAEQPRVNDYVLPVASMGRYKRLLDQASGVTGWTIQDLRRTTRTFLSKSALGVDYVVAEKLLGHELGTSVARVYEHHDFRDELAAALANWAKYLQEVILPEPTAKVAKLEPKAA
jgi:integrase